MTDPERSLMQARLNVILQRALVEIRNLTRLKAHQQIHDLADTVEFLPDLLIRWNDSIVPTVRAALQQYEARYATSAARYTSIWDMPEEEFNQAFRPATFEWDDETTRETLQPDKINATP